MITKYSEIIAHLSILFFFLCLQLFSLLQPAAAAQLPTPVHHISIEFNLQSNSFKADSRIELPAGRSIALDISHLNVSRILINGQPADIDEGNGQLAIPESSSDQEVLITYSMVFPPGIAPYSMISESGIALTGKWYPETDHEMLFKLTAQIPQDFEAISEADEIISTTNADKKQVIFRFPHPLNAINFIAGPYLVTRETFGNGKSLFAYFFTEDKELAAEYLVKARKYLERYEDLLGPYPYQRFSIVENRLPTGFAMPTFTLLGQAVVRLPFIVDTSLGHEVLHSWFGNGVRMSPNEGNWVEGLTTYLADQSFAADEGRDTVYRKEQLIKYQSFVRPEMGLTLRVFSNVGHEDMKEEPLRAVGYNKSAMFFHMLRNKVGPDVFTATLRDFVKRFKYKTAGWSDLLTSFESGSGTDLKIFFAQWLDRADIPILTVQETEVENKDGYPVVHFSIVQQTDAPYDLEVPIVIKTEKEEIHKTLHVSEAKNTYNIPMTSVPLSLAVDPGYDLMRKLALSELPATWSQFLGAEKKIAVLPEEENRELFKSLLAELADADVRVLLQGDLNDKDLSANALLFLGTEGSLSRSLFAQPKHPAEGFVLDARRNPLNPYQVAVLVSASDSAQVEKASRKLRHYGKYSYLAFKDGIIREKNITETDMGIRVELVRLPVGIETDRSKPFDDIAARLANYQVIYVGENHTSYEDHLLQLEIIRAMYEHSPRLAIGMEMFNRPVQPVIDRYLAGELDEKSFLKESGYFKNWSFDYRFYRDIINFAKYNHLPIIALNLEKDIVDQVFREGGPSSLDYKEVNLLPVDRRLDEPGYRGRLETAYMMHAVQAGGGDFSSFLQAQALWDETMAETIVNYLQGHPEESMVIIAGRGHVDKKNAIPPRVTRRLPASQAVVVNGAGMALESESADFVFFSLPAELPPFPVLGVMLDDTADQNGVLVTGLNPLGQAQKAGIKNNDTILAIDSEPVNDIEDVKIAMLYKETSDTVTVKVRRSAFLFGTKEFDIEVPLKSKDKTHPM